MKFSARSRRLLVAISVLAINMADASPASETVVSVVNEKGERVSINNTSIRQTPIYKGALYSVLKTKDSNHRSSILQFSECRKSMDQFYCWRIYGEDTLVIKRKIPGTLSQIAFDPLYVVVDYKPVITDLNMRQRVGEDALIVCLNPNVPSGYWSAINQYNPILKSTPNMENIQQPLEALKFKVCKQFVRF
jgi:hypothetical protein